MEPKDVYDFNAWFVKKYSPLLRARTPTFYQALMLCVARNAKNIVETGTARRAGNWEGEGQSTVLFGDFAKRYGCKLWTCDINPKAIEESRQSTAEFAPHIEYVVSDSVAFLRDFREPIDLLYLDSMDFIAAADPNPAQDHALLEGQAALHALHMQSVVLIDDCAVPHGGKGGKVIPFLLGQGWQVISLHYQVLLTHTFDSMGKLPPFAKVS